MIETDDICCYECGEEIEADASPGVWVHSRELGDAAYDLDDAHTARPDDENIVHPGEAES